MMEALRQATAADFVRGSRVAPLADEGEAGRVVSVRLEGLSKQYGTFDAVRDVSLDVRNGEFLTLLGPSGSGKTTTLMMIAGFVTPSSGRILVDGRDVTDEPPHRRNIGMVYQSYALFPHLTVFKNVAFPLEVRKCPQSEIKDRAIEALEIVKLADLGDRYPACESELTPEIMLAANIATNHYGLETAKDIEIFRRDMIVKLATLFDQVDFIICATNPDVAFPAKGPMPTVVDGVDLVSEVGFEAAVGNNGALTIPANTTGNPAVAIPAGLVDGLPVSMQIIGRHHAEPLLLELARVVERQRPWPLVAPGAPV